MYLLRLAIPSLTPLESTVDYRRAGRSLEQPAEPFKVALVAYSPPSPTRELEDLLRKRLLVIALLATVSGSLFVLAVVLPHHPTLIADPQTFLAEHPIVPFALFVVGIEACIATVLLRRRSWKLARLRFFEILVFAPGAAFYAWDDWKLIGLRAPGALQYGNMMVNAITLKWFMFIIIYGILIPTTWRRCVIVLCLLSLSSGAERHCLVAPGHPR
jgi:hypothetical protein